MKNKKVQIIYYLFCILLIELALLLSIEIHFLLSAVFGGIVGYFIGRGDVKRFIVYMVDVLYNSEIDNEQ